MTSKFLRRAALAVAITAGTLSAISSEAVAQQGYSSPAHWNNFRPALDEALAAEGDADDLLAEELPAPQPTREPSRAATSPSDRALAPTPDFAPSPTPRNYTADEYATGETAPRQTAPRQAAPHSSSSAGQPMVGDSMNDHPQPTQDYSTHGAGPHASAPHASALPADGSCSSCQDGSPYSQAMSSPWPGAAGASSYAGAACGDNFGGVAARPELYPWFGGANLLFFDLEEGRGKRIATGLGSDFTTSRLDPAASVGFDTTVGRYFGCGQFGLGVSYFLWNPGEETINRSTTAGNIRAGMPAYNGINVNLGSGPLNVYGLIDNYATNVWAQRDLSFQGIEANIYSFGLMGAQRAAYAGCSPQGRLNQGPFGLGAGRGFGGAAGPLVRSGSGRVRVATSHGFRWFQIKDDMQFAYDTAADPAPAGPDYAAYAGGGLPMAQIHDQLEIENNLFGYQLGGMLTFCLGKRLDINVGGKFGLYGNRVEMDHCVWTDSGLAYITAAGVDDIHSSSTDTVLSTLGELDLGLGYRISNAWTVRGGYRLIGVTGVASAADSFPTAYTSAAEAAQVHADDSYLLHGGYVGCQFNW